MWMTWLVAYGATLLDPLDMVWNAAVFGFVWAVVYNLLNYLGPK